MAANPVLVEWVKSLKAQGYDSKQIYSYMVQQGYRPEQATEAINASEKPVAAAKKVSIFPEDMPVSPVVMVLGVFFVILTASGLFFLLFTGGPSEAPYDVSQLSTPSQSLRTEAPAALDELEPSAEALEEERVIEPVPEPPTTPTVLPLSAPLPEVPIIPEAPADLVPTAPVEETPTTTGTTHTIGIQSFAFVPPELTIAVGDTVTWTNQDQATHTAASDTGAFDSGELPNGGTYSFTFTEKGSFPYTCGIHDTMKGTIIVNGVVPPPGVEPEVEEEVVEEEPPTEEPPAEEPPTEPSGPQEHLILYQGFEFIPKDLDVKKGDTVKWTNVDTIVHTITSDDGVFDSGDMNENDVFEYTFDEVGTFPYTCNYHETMVGSVIVSE